MVCSLWVSVVIELGRGRKIETESRKSCIQIRPFLNSEAFNGRVLPSGVAVALAKVREPRNPVSVIEADLINRQGLLTQTGEIHNGQTLSSLI
jgi:hypothetical protein